MTERAPASEAPNWQSVIQEAQLVSGRATGVMVAGLPVVIVRDDAGLHALPGICPHDQASLAGGEVASGILICPRYRARFELSTGVCVGGFTLPPLIRYPVRVRDGCVEVDGDAVTRKSAGDAIKRRWDLTRGGS